jgi:F5/8 type C domain
MQIKTKIGVASFCSTLVMLSTTGAASAAGLIFSPVSGVINSGGAGYGSLADTYNQNGLANKFVSGVTDFDSYLSLNPTHNYAYAGNEWFSNLGTQSTTVTYDLGSVRSIDRLALWNEDASGIGRLNLAYSTDNITFSSLAAGLTPSNNALNLAYSADVFGFATTNARYVRFEASECRQSVFAACAFGEVAFSISTPASSFPNVSIPNVSIANRATAAVPEPLTIAGTLIGGTAALRIRRRLKITNKL